MDVLSLPNELWLCAIDFACADGAFKSYCTIRSVCRTWRDLAEHTQLRLRMLDPWTRECDVASWRSAA